ncbi:hypothetical protein T484DRAFT_2018513 [Baffinella frigidus]|nr:hypothetical protein T484DRAFT_2018513 [Cryptophyta sp. CCMP2293]
MLGLGLEGMYGRWPAWAVNPFIGCVMLCGLVILGQSQLVGNKEPEKKSAKKGGGRDAEFQAFQRQWLLVYLLTMLADWLQGTHMYSLYESYGQPPGMLFSIGFTSSAVFGTFLGILVDKYGRKRACIAFCLLEIVINLLEHVNNWELLILGRVLGGISTSLLFTAFESWMVSEHRRRGFPEEDLAKTFSLAQKGNGICAVLAGVMAQVSADHLGHIGPFQLAIFLTILALFFVLSWRENYGGDGSDNEKQHLFGDAVKCIRKDSRILLLGMNQSLFEGAMYTFVIMWVPTLARMVPGGRPGEFSFDVFAPGQGWIFAAMMVCITIGGELFAGMLKITTVWRGCVVIFFVAASAMLVPIFSSSFGMVLASFLVVEACVGATFGAMATMRTKLLPDALQASIMNIFRLPLNLLVVTGGRLGDLVAPKHVFATVSAWFFLAGILQVLLQHLVTASDLASPSPRKPLADPLAKSPLPAKKSKGARSPSPIGSATPKKGKGGDVRSPVRTRKSTGGAR